LIPGSRDLIPNPRELIPNPRDLIPDPRELIPNPRDLIPDPRELIPNPRDLIPDPRELIPDPRELIPNPRDLIPDPRELIPNPRDLIPDPRDLIPDPRELIPNLVVFCTGVPPLLGASCPKPRPRASGGPRNLRQGVPPPWTPRISAARQTDGHHLRSAALQQNRTQPCPTRSGSQHGAPPTGNARISG